MGESFAKELETLLFDLLEVVFCSFRTPSRIFKISVCSLESVLHNPKAFDRSHIRSHALELTVQRFDVILQFSVYFIVVALGQISVSAELMHNKEGRATHLSQVLVKVIKVNLNSVILNFGRP